MSYKTATVVLASAVASAGTFTVGYPAETDSGTFPAYGHYIMCRGLGGAKFSVDAGTMSISFGASEITVTYLGSTSIPANSAVVCHFNMRGQDDGRVLDIGQQKRMIPVLPYRIDLGAPDTADDNGVCESQTVTGAGTAAVLNGVYADPYAGAKAVLDVPRALAATWGNSQTITVTGKDEYGDVIVERSSASTSFTGKKAFKEITSVTTDGTITSFVLGTTDVLGLPVYVAAAGDVLVERVGGAVVPPTSGVVYLTGNLLVADVDAGTPFNIVSPVAGRIRKLTTIADDGGTTGGAFTVEVNTTAVDGLSVTVANSFAEGDVDSDTPTAGHATTVVAVGDRIEIIPSSGFDTSGDFNFVLEIQTTHSLNGTFVAGVQTTPTATTGDVKGTYDPVTACDGSTTFALVASLADPNYRGVDNYDG